MKVGKKYNKNVQLIYNYKHLKKNTSNLSIIEYKIDFNWFFLLIFNTKCK